MECLSDRFAAHLSAHASRYYGDLPGDPRVRLENRIDRPISTLYEFSLGDETARRAVLVKVAEPPRTPQDRGDDRPRRVTTPPPADKTRLEYDALTCLHEYFGALNDPRFGSIRPLDLILPPGALVMEKAREPRLSRLMLPAHRFGRLAPTRLHSALRHAGAWLAAWHRHPARDRRQATMPTAAAFCEFTGQLTDYLTATIGHRALFAVTRARVVSEAARVLPADLPLGMSHGDYAPRNVLVAPDGRVTVLDTLARHRTPIYADLAHFLMALETAGPQVLTQGLWFSRAALAAWREAFLEGYFAGARVPAGALRLFELQMLLDKWTSVTLRARLAGPAVANRLRGWSWNLYLEKYLRRLVDSIEAPNPHAEA